VTGSGSVTGKEDIMVTSGTFLTALGGKKARKATALIALAAGSSIGLPAHATDRHWNIASGTHKVWPYPNISEIGFQASSISKTPEPATRL